MCAQIATGITNSAFIQVWLLEGIYVRDSPKTQLLSFCHQCQRAVKCSLEIGNYILGCDTLDVSHCWKGTPQTPPQEQQCSTAGERTQLLHTGQTTSWELTSSEWTAAVLINCQLTTRILLTHPEECWLHKSCSAVYYVLTTCAHTCSNTYMYTRLYL